MNDGQARAIRKFNPGTLQSDAELVDQFVVRERELGAVLETLRENADAPCCQNVLVVGTRGSGKTMLLARAAAELRRDRGLSKHLQPVRLMEENSEIFDIGEFWLEVLFQLILEVEAEHPEIGNTLRTSRNDLIHRWRPELGQEALGVVLEGARLLERRLVLLVENMQDLCRDTDGDFGWQLRGTLQSEPRIMLVGSATTRFNELQDATSAFFELFRFVELRRLDSAECLRIWRMICGDRTSRREARPLEILTGGNPRLVAIMAEFANHRSMPALFENLVALIDDQCEYFRSQMERLPKGERRVYIAIADRWQPSTTGEVAIRARMEGRAVSTFLGRLVERGLLLAEGDGRKRRYALAERLYGIYYKLRRERDTAGVVNHLIGFMAAFYSADELTGLSANLVGEPSLASEVWEGVARALREEPRFAGVFNAEALDALLASMKCRQDKRALKLARRLLDRKELQPLVRSTAALVVGRVYKALRPNDKQLDEDRRKAIETLEEIVHEYDEAVGLQELVNGAEAARPSACRPFGMEAGDVLAIEQSVELVEVIALSVVFSHIGLGEILCETGNPSGAANRYEVLVRKFGASSRPVVQHQVATALSRLGDVYRWLGDDANAVSAWGRFVEKVESGAASRPRSELGRALVLREHALERMGLSSGVEGWDAVIRRFPDPAEPGIQRPLLEAMLHKGVALARQGALEEAKDLWRELVNRHRGATDAEVVTGVRVASAAMAMAQARTGEVDEAWEAAETLEREAGAGREILWHARRVKVTVRLVQRRLDDAVDELGRAYETFVPSRSESNELISLVCDVVGAGVRCKDLAELLLGDQRKANAVSPLVTALMLESGEFGVRGPAEVLEVAEDIRTEFRRHRA